MPDCDVAESHLYGLIRLFYSNTAELGVFQWQPASQCPAAYQRLLNHSAHMTVTVEQYHGQSVNVQVLDQLTVDQTYHRKILLRRSTDDQVVQFGIVSVNLDCLAEKVCEQIMAGTTPLGRILIQHQVMREVQLCGLWRIQCGPELSDLFDLPHGAVTYGRTARILVKGHSGIELLEIVTAVHE